MQRYILSEQILGIILSEVLLKREDEIKLSDLNCTVRSINNQVQKECETVINFSGRDIYGFVYTHGKYFRLSKDKVILSQYTKSEIERNYDRIEDLFDTKFISGLPEDIVSIVNKKIDDC